MQWKVFQDKEMNADGWLSHCSVSFVMASKKAVDYMIKPIHCCKHSMRIALVIQGYPESLFVSWKAFDDKEANRPAFCCIEQGFRDGVRMGCRFCVHSESLLQAIADEYCGVSRLSKVFICTMEGN
jgi:hypothetical protein